MGSPLLHQEQKLLSRNTFFLSLITVDVSSLRSPIYSVTLTKFYYRYSQHQWADFPGIAPIYPGLDGGLQ